MSCQPKKILLLENIRSTHNVGAIFRTADAAGIDEIILIGETSTPIDKYGRPRKDIAKTALGAEQTLPYRYFTTTEEILPQLKRDGYFLLAIEQAENSVDYKTVTPHDKIVIIMGNEVRGVNPETLSLCDQVAEITMMGQKESLNVAVTTGIVLFRLFNI